MGEPRPRRIGGAERGLRADSSRVPSLRRGRLMQLISETAVGFWNHLLISAYGYKQTSSRPKMRSALPPKADISMASADFHC